MDARAGIIPINFIKDIFNTGDMASLPVIDIIAFEGYGSLINLGRGYPGGRYSTEKVCIRSEYRGKVSYFRLDWIWAGGLYGSRFIGPTGTWEGGDFIIEDADVSRSPSRGASGDVEVRDLFDAARSRRHCCALKAVPRGDDLVLRFTYAEQQDPVQGPTLQTTICCRRDDPVMIKVNDARQSLVPSLTSP
ncbi:hypothetical protein [uncultured Methanofollis sp.]|uniref:hypothetical protein n=1 Tax=uncultured Methanofollis sp. TaxID=262500 RepID=UPI00262B776E|nr:hypothetical protein [uncultured Methanofollis sp.]